MERKCFKAGPLDGFQMVYTHKMLEDRTNAIYSNNYA